MSRSWTSLARPFAASPPLGVALGRRRVVAARLEGRRVGRHVSAWHEAPLARPLFEGPADEAAAAALTEALRQVRGARSRGPVRAQVALPDPAVSLRVFALERLPPSRRLQAELVRWRFAQELAAEPDRYACTHQVYGKDGGRHLVLGLATAADWARLVLDACRAAGLLVTALDAEACHRHNRFRTRICEAGIAGMLAALLPESWSVSAWDGAGRLCLLRARWREAEPASAPAERETVGGEVERLARAYAQACGGMMGTFWVTGPRPDAAWLADRLDDRLRERCRVLPADEDAAHPSASAMANIDASAAALAAAIPR